MLQLNQKLLSPATKPILFLVLLLPFFWLLAKVMTNDLGANPAEALIRSTGDWTIRMLCLVLAITPMRVSGGLSALARMRRMVGLFVFFYACIHMLSYSGFDMDFDVKDIASDIPKRPFILVGFTAFVLLMLMALTSFNRAIRWLGAKRWQTLHKSIYIIVLLAILHFFWMRSGKRNFGDVIEYTLILSALMAWRLRNKYLKFRILQSG